MISKFFISVIAAALAAAGLNAQEEIGRIERSDPGFDELVAPDAVIELLVDGHDWVEGPVWDEDGEQILFSDIPRNTIYAWSETGGESVYMKPSGYTGIAEPGREPGSNGLAFDSEGRLLLCEHGDRRVARLTHGGGKITVADRFDGRRFNSPNDLAVHSSGAIYFTDPPYGLPRGADDPRRELDFCGVYRIGTDGTVAALIRDLPRPNGITLSPDESTLYVAQSHGPDPVVMAYPLREDGTVGEGRVFFDTSPFVSSGPGMPDGLKTDVNGNVWATGPGGVFVLSPEGELLGRLITNRPTANLAFGGPEGNILFLTANDSLCRVVTRTKGSR